MLTQLLGILRRMAGGEDLRLLTDFKLLSLLLSSISVHNLYSSFKSQAMDQVPSIGVTFGSALVGLLIGAVLYGVTLVQTWFYFRHYEKDSRGTKSLVLLLWFLDTLHLALCVRTIYWYLVTNYAHPEALKKTMWSMNIQTDCNGLIGLMVEVFFARRVWMMSRNRLVTGLIVILASIHFSLGIVFTVEAFLLQEYSRYTQLTWITCTGLGSAAAADLLIAMSMCYYLFRSRTGFQKTDSMITMLMLYSINTGLITSIVATGAVIAFATMPLNFVWLGFFWVLGKCYVNSLLASLNGRESLRERSHVEPSSFLQLSTIRRDDELPGPRSRVSAIIRRPAPTLSVTVETTTEYKSDFLNSPVAPSLVSTTSPDMDPDKLKGSDSTPSLVPLVPRPVRHRTLL